MNSTLRILAVAMFGMAGCTRHTVTLESLLREMTDIESVAEFPVPGYVCLQQSSHDRRSVAPDRPGWYANADGFGAIAIDTANGVIRHTLAGAAEQHDRKTGKEQRNRTASRSGTTGRQDESTRPGAGGRPIQPKKQRAGWRGKAREPDKRTSPHRANEAGRATNPQGGKTSATRSTAGRCDRMAADRQSAPTA
ncbi:MAG: hypothetical protein IJC16_08510 [Rikenellaceae bacterium]|nr:hypothetical protein [Rikenellaceae bacterium]